MIYEILMYQLYENQGSDFHEIMISESLPLHKQWNIDVVYAANSLADSDNYILVRRFADSFAYKQVLSDFYDSAAWRSEVRNKIVSRIKLSTTVVLDETDFLKQMCG
ncbi:NIPSNAP family protein [Culicoidibacter larvae]|uniref:NIPSNAP family protein n=1 Tax=Culicoidibacter larvae TaxID=2579976 RepID=A0A5R8Q8T7_9FIRM|nr:NIPSNAP family protein [Culicoidibacter larvae]TLG71531.1 NIPSNAP family protein [Culicoidibacter larvae]